MSDLEFTVTKQDLSRLLARAASIASGKSPMVIMQNVLLEASTGTLTARATDTYLSFESRVPADVKSPGSICVDARKAAAVAKELPEGDVKLKLKDTTLTLKAGKASFKLPTIPAGEFPPLPRVEDAHSALTADAGDLLRCILQGSYAMYPDDKRPELQAMLVEPSGSGVRFVSLDNKRCAVANLEAQWTGKKRLLIPAKGVNEFRKVCEANKGNKVSLLDACTVIVVLAGDSVLGIKSQQEELFPPYAKLIPATSEQIVTISKELLTASLRRVAVMSEAKEGSRVDLTFSPGSVRVSTEGGESEDSVDCDADFDLVIAVNADIMVQAANAFTSDDVRLEMMGERRHIVMRSAVDAECVGIITPMLPSGR